MEKKNLFGLLMSDAESTIMVNKYRKFETEAEALAYALGVDDASIDNEDESIFGDVGRLEPEPEWNAR